MQESLTQTELISSIDLLLSRYQLDDELEIRFGYYESKYFRSSISYQVYNKLLDNFINDSQYSSSFSSNTIHMYSNGIRQIKTQDKDVIIKKNKKNRLDDYDLGIRVALSNEKKLLELPSGKYVKKTRHRHTFLHNSSKYKIDLTIDSLPKYKQFQCEIEFLQKPSSDSVVNMITLIKSLMNDNQSI